MLNKRNNRKFRQAVHFTKYQMTLSKNSKLICRNMFSACARNCLLVNKKRCRAESRIHRRKRVELNRKSGLLGQGSGTPNTGLQLHTT